jgi:hypothetical protein
MTLAGRSPLGDRRDETLPHAGHPAVDVGDLLVGERAARPRDSSQKVIG